MDKNVTTFATASAQYSSARPTYPIELYTYLSEIAPAQNSAWDCACGTGQVSQGLSRYFQKIEASDLHTQQLSKAPAISNVRYSRQKAEQTDYPDQCFDLVCVAQALHWFDLDRFFNELDRVLKPRGIFAYWGYGFTSISPDIDPIMAKEIFTPLDPYWSEGNQLLWNHYREVEPPYPIVASPQFSMTIDWTLDEFRNYIQTWSAYKRLLEQEGKDPLPEFRNKIKPHWDDNERRTLTMDFTFTACRKPEESDGE
jgi:SAM-dependent methyltransferase